MRLLIGMKTCPGPGENNGTITGELVTPTAAALLRVLTGVADYENSKTNSGNATGTVRIGRPPIFTPRAVGIGAGTKDFIKHPNVIRLILGDECNLHDGKVANVPPGDVVVQMDNESGLLNNKKTNISEPETLKSLEDKPKKDQRLEPSQNLEIISKPSETRSDDIENSGIGWNIDRLTLLQTNIDDITSEALSYVMNLLLKNGAIDVWVESIVMKKGRSAHQLNCLLHSNDSNDSNKEETNTTLTTMMQIIFRHTTTLGVRIQRDIERAALRRKLIQVQTIYGIGNKDARDGLVDVKVAYINNEVVSMKAEFDHCKAISEQTGNSLKLIADNAIVKARNYLDL